MELDGDRYGIHGRDTELGLIDTLLRQAEDGHGAALVIRAHAGLGKTTLLRAARQRTGMTALAANGAESEAALPFAGLHQLLAPLLDTPAGERLLRTVFLPANRPNLFTVGLAALDLLRAAECPLALLVDDAHRLDPETVDVLVFVARRLARDPFALLITVGARHTDVLAGVGVDELRLFELDATAAGRILTDRSPELTSPQRERVLAEAAGHPLALAELPHGDETLTDRLRTAFEDRFAHLPEATRAILAALAADPDCPPDAAITAARALTGTDVGPAHIQPAIDADVLEIHARRLRFRHPLVRSAVYAGLPVTDRLTVHSVLADAFAGDLDRRAFHRSAATLGPDEQVGHEVEKAADRALDRGARVTAVTDLERAADLTLDSARRTSLLLRAAELASQLDDRTEAARLAATADPGPGDVAGLARLALVGDVVDPGDLRDPGRIDALCDLALRAHEAGETGLAMALCWQAVSRCWRAGLPAEAGAQVIAVHGKLGFDSDDPRSIAIAAYAQPDLAGADLLRRLRGLVPDRTDVDGMHFLASAAMVLGDPVTATSFLGTAISGYRADGRGALLARALSSTSFPRLWLGRWPLVRAGLDEAEALAGATGELFWQVAARAGQAMHEALRGEVDEAFRLADEVLASPLMSGVRSVTAAAQHARGVAANAAGRHDEAFDLLLRVFVPSDPAHHPDMSGWALPDLADAALRSGRRDEIQDILAAAANRAIRLPSPMLRRSLSYADVVVNPGEAAFERARSLDLTEWPLHRARLDLAHGTWLRRDKRILESRVPLRAARDGFDALGAAAWARTAREELRAAGEEGAQVTVERLTVQEFRTAELAAAGLSNREIGQRLFLSPRTVSSHLYRIYPKLGISGRSQLRAALSGSQPTDS